MPRIYEFRPMCAYSTMSSTSCISRVRQKCTCFSTDNRWHSQLDIIPSRHANFTQSIWFRTAQTVVGGFFFREWDVPSDVDLQWLWSPADNVVEFRYESTISGQNVQFKSDGNHATLNDNNWHNLVISSNSYSAVHMSIDGVLAAPTFTQLMTSPDTPAFNRRYAIGDDILNGCVSDFWWIDEYIPLTNAANRQLFYNNGWVYLGDEGEIPTGNPALTYLRDSNENFGTNYGSLGDLVQDSAYNGGACVV